MQNIAAHNKPKTITATLFICLGLIALCCLFLVPFTGTIAAAQTNEQHKTPTRTKASALTIKKRHHKQLILAQNLLEKNQRGEAQKALNGLINNPTVEHYAQALALKMISYMHYQDENYEKSIATQRQILTKKLPNEVITESLHSVAQLYFVTGDYQSAVEYFQQWYERSSNHPAKSLALISQTYYQLGDYKAAIEPMHAAVSQIERDQSVAKEGWYLVLRAAYYELGELNKAVAVLEKLALHYPKRRYWLQLSGIYGQLDNSNKQLSALEIARISNLLTKANDIKNLAYLYLAKDIPFKAATVLEQALATNTLKPTDSNLHLLSTAWSLAQESDKALPVLIRAANASSKGQLDTQLAKLYFNTDQWKRASDAIERAYKKQTSSRSDDTDLLYAMSLYHQDRLQESLQVFNRVAQGENAVENADNEAIGGQWVSHIQGEVARREALAALSDDTQAINSNRSDPVTGRPISP